MKFVELKVINVVTVTYNSLKFVFELNTFCFNTTKESENHMEHSDAVFVVLIVCDIPTIPKLIPPMITSEDPVLGKFVELVKIVGSVTFMAVPILWI